MFNQMVNNIDLKMTCAHRSKTALCFISSILALALIETENILTSFLVCDCEPLFVYLYK